METPGEESVAGSVWQLLRPQHCFCGIAIAELRRWARKKYIDHVPTMDLLAMAKNSRQKEAVSIVALLDLPDEVVIRMLGPMTKPGCRILACRDHVRQWLDGMLAVLN